MAAALAMANNNPNPNSPTALGTSQIMLLCPDCLAPLITHKADMRCPACGRDYPVVDGVPKLTLSDHYFGEFPRQRMKAFLASAETDPERALARLLAENAAPPRLGEYIIGAGRAGWKFLLPFSQDSVALDLGCGWGAVAYSLAHSCRHVVAMDTTFERMCFLQYRAAHSGVTNLQCLCAGDGRYLPFPDATFDLIILNGVLEWVPIGSRLHPRRAQLNLLRDVCRVLRPTGVLYLAIENRFAWKTWFWLPDGHTGLRFVPWLPRPLASLYSRLRRKGPYRNFLYSRRGLAQLLSLAGFRHTAAYVPLPGYHHPTTMVRADDRTAIAQHTWRRGRGIRHALRQIVRSNLTARYPDSYSLLAHRTGDAPSFLGRLIAFLNQRIPTRMPEPVEWTLYRINGEMGMVTVALKGTQETPGVVLKLPLHKRGYEGLRREVEYFGRNGLADKRLALIRGLLPTAVWAGEFEGHYFAAFEQLPGQPPHAFSLNAGRDTALLRAAATFATQLHNCSARQRACAAALPDCVGQAFANACNLARSERHRVLLADLWRQLGDDLEELSRISVIGHGDFKIGNCLFKDRRVELTGVIDWGAGLCEELPLYDLTFLLVDFAWQYRRISLERALRGIRSGDNLFAGMRDIVLGHCEEVRMRFRDKYFPALARYQWLKRMAPVGSGYECRRYDYRFVDSMFDVLADLLK